MKPSLYRLFRTSYFLSHRPWQRALFRFKRFNPAAMLAVRPKQAQALPPHVRASLDRQAYDLAKQLPVQVLPMLADSLQVRLFGETARFDHLDFAAWFNGYFDDDSHVHSDLYETFSALFSQVDQRAHWALDVWISDLAVMGELMLLLRANCRALTGYADLQAEHVHLKSWQVRGYKAHWWHLDRGEISAIATISGHPTTEFLLEDDPAPYPEKPRGDDVFVFPESLSQTVHRSPADDVLVCGARARKESGKSYLWHRAPISQVERIVLVLKTLPPPAS